MQGGCSPFQFYECIMKGDPDLTFPVLRMHSAMGSSPFQFNECIVEVDPHQSRFYECILKGVLTFQVLREHNVVHQCRMQGIFTFAASPMQNGGRSSPFPVLRMHSAGGFSLSQFYEFIMKGDPHIPSSGKAWCRGILTFPVLRMHSEMRYSLSHFYECIMKGDHHLPIILRKHDVWGSSPSE